MLVCYTPLTSFRGSISGSLSLSRFLYKSSVASASEPQHAIDAATKETPQTKLLGRRRVAHARRHQGAKAITTPPSGGAARPACAPPPCAPRRPSCARRWRPRRYVSSSRFEPANGTVTKASKEGRRHANLLRRRSSIESFLARGLLCGFISDLLLALALGLRGLGLRPVWKSNFGRLTPSTLT